MDGSDRGISPVISTILLVAVVVILAATISVPVLGLGENINDPAPSAALEVSETESETVELAHIAGNTIEGDNLEIRGGEIIETEMPETIEAGTTIEIDPAPDVDDITVTWEGKEQSAVLLQESVSAGLGGDGAIGAGDILILQTEDGEPLEVGDTYNTTADLGETPVIQVPNSANVTWEIGMTTDLPFDPSTTEKSPGESATIPEWMLGLAVPEEGEIVGVTENEANNEYVVEVATCTTDC